MQIPSPDELCYVGENDAPYLAYSDFKKSPVNRIKLACIILMLDQAIRGGRGKILEVGCGIGNVAIPIASLGYHVTACDIHEPSIAIARRRNPFGNLQFVHGSTDLVNPGEYDGIILTDFLEHVGKYREMISSIARSMKSDCTLIITVPNGWGITELLCRPSYALKKWPGGRALVKVIKRLLKTSDLTTANLATPHVHFFTLRQLRKLFEDYSLAITSFRQFFFLWPLRETFFSQRSYPVNWPENDLALSQKLPPTACAFWAFSLKKDR